MAGDEEHRDRRLAPRGEARETQKFRLTLAGWRARPRPEVTVEGLDACRWLFGLDGTGPEGAKAR